MPLWPSARVVLLVVLLCGVLIAVLCSPHYSGDAASRQSFRRAAQIEFGNKREAIKVKSATGSHRRQGRAAETNSRSRDTPRRSKPRSQVPYLPPSLKGSSRLLTQQEMPAICPSVLYNRGWDGYRLADMLISRFQRHTASGMHYHLQAFPNSLVANFLDNYKIPGARNTAGRAHSSRYEIITNGKCHPGHNLSRYPLDTSSCQKAGVPEHLQCCRYILPVPALVDMLARRRWSSSAAAAEEEAAVLSNTAAIHIRAGEVIDLSPCSVDAMMARFTRFARQCKNPERSAREWTGTSCMEQQAFFYVMPRSHWEWVRGHLERHHIRHVVIVAGSALNLTVGFAKSCEYLQRVGSFFATSGFEVVFRLGMPPDDDVSFFTRSAVFVQTGGAFSRIVAQAARVVGATVVASNRSQPPPIKYKKRATKEKFVQYLC